MPKAAPTLETPYRRGEKVLAMRDLPGVPEGTQGKVRMVNGLNSWLRYWVLFEDGTMVGQVNQDDLVRRNQVDAWHQREEDRELAAEQAAAGIEAEAEAPAAVADVGGGAASLIPAHLLERSKAAKTRLLG